MDKEYLLKTANTNGERIWSRFASMFKPIGERPIIVLNNRLRTTLGRAWLDDGKVDLSTKLFVQYHDEFIAEVIPHEYAHFVAWRVYGDAGHGKQWKHVMRRFGLEPRRVFTW